MDALDKLEKKLKEKGIEYEIRGDSIIIKDFRSFCKILNGGYNEEKYEEYCIINLDGKSMDMSFEGKNLEIDFDVLNLGKFLGLEEELLWELTEDFGISRVKYVEKDAGKAVLMTYLPPKERFEPPYIVVSDANAPSYVDYSIEGERLILSKSKSTIPKYVRVEVLPHTLPIPIRTRRVQGY